MLIPLVTGANYSGNVAAASTRGVWTGGRAPCNPGALNPFDVTATLGSRGEPRGRGCFGARGQREASGIRAQGRRPRSRLGHPARFDTHAPLEPGHSSRHLTVSPGKPGGPRTTPGGTPGAPRPSGRAPAPPAPGRPHAGAAGTTHQYSRWLALKETTRHTCIQRRRPGSAPLIASLSRTRPHLLSRRAAGTGGRSLRRGCALRAAPPQGSRRRPAAGLPLPAWRLQQGSPARGIWGRQGFRQRGVLSSRR